MTAAEGGDFGRETGDERDSAPAPTPPPAPVTLVTGLSGAGNSTAIRALEDMGHEAIDNLPLTFIERLLAQAGAPEAARNPAAGAGAGAQDGADGTGAEAAAPEIRPLALGVDVRTRGFTAEALLARIDALRARPDVALRVIFLDCAEPALIDRFKATRRRHPLAGDAGVEVGIGRERSLLWPVRERADMVIDTSDLTPHDLKARLAGLGAPGGAPGGGAAGGLVISIQSFSFKRGAPREADTVLDCRFLANPHWNPGLRPLDGRDAPVADHVAGDPLYAPFMEGVTGLTLMLLPAYRREGKAYYCMALGCSGGRHRSVAAAEDLSRRLAAAGWTATVRHRELAERETG
ncbi:MAG: RapZ family nucleotide-binding protein [Pseudomonadota bacterium]|nr:RapZ family nucleotide-binding protein [Pseudomonadota bacterium]MEE3098198.1 RapZ family nucleotide-binding protein [Pseudomonadota bacterium]